MPTIELSETPRSPNSSRAASRILRCVRSPRAVRGVLAAPVAPSCALSSTLTPIPLPYRAAAQSQVETRFKFHYDHLQSRTQSRRPRRGETLLCASFLHAPLCSARLPPRRFLRLRRLPAPRKTRTPARRRQITPRHKRRLLRAAIRKSSSPRAAATSCCSTYRSRSPLFRESSSIGKARSTSPRSPTRRQT